MSKGSPRIVIRLTAEEMLFVQAAADTTSVDVKHLAKMGVLKEAMDVRNKLIEHMRKGADRHGKSGKKESSNALQDGESQGVSGDSLHEQSQAGDDTGAGT